MRLAFTKMHGLGNDFVVIDAINQSVNLTPHLIKQIADRHFGIGCDQLLLVEPAVHQNSDFRYRIFNADGGEVSQCGNGARCLARFVRDKGLSDKKEIRVDTNAGPLQLNHADDGSDSIRVGMGVPRHMPVEIPLKELIETTQYGVEIDGATWAFGAVSIGNPHAVIRVDNVESAPIEILGNSLQTSPLFPESVNVGCMEVRDPHTIRLRVYERGAGETLACGSGACAAAIVGIEQKILENPVRVDLPGGQLMICWRGRGQPVFLMGPAVSVFDGIIDL